MVLQGVQEGGLQGQEQEIASDLIIFIMMIYIMWAYASCWCAHEACSHQRTSSRSLHQPIGTFYGAGVLLLRQVVQDDVYEVPWLLCLFHLYFIGLLQHYSVAERTQIYQAFLYLRQLGRLYVLGSAVYYDWEGLQGHSDHIKVLILALPQDGDDHVDQGGAILGFELVVHEEVDDDS